MTLDEWYKKAERGTSEDMVFSILKDWKIEKVIQKAAQEKAYEKGYKDGWSDGKNDS